MTAAAGDKLFGTCAPGELSDLFSFLDSGEIDVICSFLELRHWAAGATVMQEGEAGDSMGFLVRGKLAVKKETVFPDKFVLLAVLEKGSMVGEVSAVEPGNRNVTVAAVEDSQLLVLTQEAMARLLAEFPLLGSKLLQRIIHVVGQRLRQASERLSRLL